MPKERGEQRQLRLNVDLVAIPAEQDAQHEAVTDVMNTGSAPERLAIETGRVAQPVELVPDRPLVHPHAGDGDQETRRLGVRAECVSDAGVAVQCCDGARVQRDLPGAAVLAVTNSQPAL